jgi:beta-lactamase regulating signal transducer with metallopeptidase domain
MSEFWWAATQWTVQSLVAGGAALFLGWVIARRVTDPARRHRAMGWSVRAAVLACGLALFPAWWNLRVPGWTATPEERAAEVSRIEFEEAEPVIRSLEGEWVLVPADLDQASPMIRGAIPDVEPATMARGEPEPVPAIGTPMDDGAPAAKTDLMAEIAPLVLIPYWTLVAVAILRQLIGYIGLARLRRAAVPANGRVLRIAHELTGDTPPRILVSERLASPVCFGVARPTILLPKALVKAASDEQLRWVLAHEWDHLRRGDPATGVWLGMARALYFAVPWFWSVRREIDLAQEYLADAAAAGARKTDYAAFLVELSSRPGVSRFVKAVPTLAGVRAGQSDLYRRVTMLLEPKVSGQSRWGRAGTTLAIAGAVSVAVALSGVRLVADEPKKDKKPDGEKRVEVIVKDKKDGDKKPADVVRDVDVIVVVDHSKQTAEIEKAIEEAAKKGDVEQVKKLVAKLKAAAAAHVPHVARLAQPGVPVPPKPPLPPMPPDAVAKIREVRVMADTEAKKFEEAIEKLKKAAEEVKDQPEAKAAIEKTMAEYRKKIEEARAKGHLVPADIAKGQALRWHLDGGANIQEQLKKQQDEMMKSYEKQLAALKGDEKAMAALKESMVKYKESMEVLQKQLGQLPKFDDLPRLQQLQFQGGVPGVAFADGVKAQWVARTSPAEKGRLGVTIEAVPGILVEQLDLPKGQGVILVQVFEGTPAAKAGLKVNDIVLEVAGKAVTVEALPKVVAGLKNDEAFEVTVIRKGKKESVKGVTIPSPPTKEKEKDGAKKSSQSSMSVNVNNDQFEISAKQDGVAYMLTGTIGDDAGTTIVIAEGDKKSTYKGVKSVPAEHREKVTKFLKSVGGSK